MSRPVLLIAGGSRGIGASTAKLAAARGYDVAINYVQNAKAAAEVADAVKRAGGRAATLPGDMAKEEDILRVFDQTTQSLPGRSRISSIVQASAAKIRGLMPRARPPSAT